MNCVFSINTVFNLWHAIDSTLTFFRFLHPKNLQLFPNIYKYMLMGCKLVVNDQEEVLGVMVDNYENVSSVYDCNKKAKCYERDS